MPNEPDNAVQSVGLSEAVELTGFASHYIRRLIHSGQLPAQRHKGGYRIPVDEIQHLASQQRPFWQIPPTIHPLAQIRSTADDSGQPDGVSSTEQANPERVFDNIEVGHCIDWLNTLKSESVQTVVTSPPYWGQRNYADETAFEWSDGEKAAFGREQTVEGYIRHSMEILRHIKRVLKANGTIWWVVGDTYLTRTIVRKSTVERWDNYKGKSKTTWADNPNRRHSAGHPYLKDKDLTLAPFMVAHGAQHMGLYVRSVIIWSKQQTRSKYAHSEPTRTHMPEPVKDRPTTGHEYIFLFSKSSNYYYSTVPSDESEDQEIESLDHLRSVWSFPVSTNHGGHTAAFPLELPLRCLRLTSKPGDLVIDPFAGSGNSLIAAKRLGRHFAGCDISPKYVAEARERLVKDDNRTKPLGVRTRTRRSVQQLEFSKSSPESTETPGDHVEPPEAKALNNSVPC